MATQLRMIQVGFCLLRSLPQHQLHMQCVWQISHACNMSDTTLVCTLHPTPTLTCHCQQQLDESCIGCESFALGCCSITVVSRCAQQVESDTQLHQLHMGTHDCIHNGIMHYAEQRKHSQWCHVTCRAEEALIMVSHIITHDTIVTHPRRCSANLETATFAFSVVMATASCNLGSDLCTQHTLKQPHTHTTHTATPHTHNYAPSKESCLSRASHRLRRSRERLVALCLEVGALHVDRRLSGQNHQQIFHQAPWTRSTLVSEGLSLTFRWRRVFQDRLQRLLHII
jgi:hypothetical protein